MSRRCIRVYGNEEHVLCATFVHKGMCKTFHIGWVLGSDADAESGKSTCLTMIQSSVIWTSGGVLSFMPQRNRRSTLRWESATLWVAHGTAREVLSSARGEGNM
eukprot:GHUV01035948.1.p3 GENE.GHUV01035948.1~~GHUV01035948.1.p3  ORF type:complete len:104 (-),score=7.84 GHUV01035948.1:348-659(-)